MHGTRTMNEIISITSKNSSGYISKKDLALASFLLSFVFLIYLFGLLNESKILIFSMYILNIFLDFAIFIKVRHTPPLFITALFMFMMDLYLSFYLILKIPISEPRYYPFFNYENMFTYLMIVNLFKISFFCFLKLPKKYIAISLRVKKYKSDFGFILLYIMTLILTLFGFSAKVIYFSSNSYSNYIENLKDTSGLPEYLTILYLILWLFQTKKYQKILLLSLFFIMFIKLFLYGFRVQLAMYLFLLYIVYFDKYIKKPYKLLLLGILAYLFFESFGLLKEGINLESLLNMLISSKGFILISENQQFILSQFTDVITSSLVILKKMSFENSFLSLIGFINNIFLPPRITQKLIPQSIPPAYIDRFITTIPGGIYFPISFYIRLGFLGPILFGVFLAMISNIVFNNKEFKRKNLFLIYFIIVFMTLPRWFFYTQTSYLFRFSIILFALLAILNLLKNLRKNEA